MIRLNGTWVAEEPGTHSADDFKEKHGIHPADWIFVVKGKVFERVEDMFIVDHGMEFHTTPPTGVSG